MIYNERVEKVKSAYNNLIARKNEKEEMGNGIYDRFKYPVITKAHIPIEWIYDMNSDTNPYFMERLGINAAFNPGAIELNGKVCLVVRTEGYDRKSFFAIAESKNGVDNFVFREYPCIIPETEIPDTNIYDMRLTKHEDGWIYGLFCTERRDPAASEGDQSSAYAQCGIVRTKDLKEWERLPDLKTKSPQQRNVVLHPEFVDGKYALYTRPQDSFIDAGSKGGIGFGFTESMINAVVKEEKVIEPKLYHTIKEAKNGQGPVPIKTEKGWLNLAHGVRNTAAGLRYVLYMFLTDLNDPSKVLKVPGGYFMAPEGDERTGDVSNVLFANGWIERENGEILIYYASSDTRVHVAATSKERLLDYILNTPEDPMKSYDCVVQRMELINKNKSITAGK